MLSSTQIFLVIMKVFSYDFGVPGTVQFPLFEVPWGPCLPGEGAAISKPHSTYKFERSLLHVILCRITGKKVLEKIILVLEKSLIFPPKILYEP